MMMEILSVIHDKQAGRFIAAQDLGDRLGQLVFPDDTLEWRAAEYQIEPTETDLLMDIVLYEQFLPATQPGEIPALWSAPTIEEARDRHVEAIMKAKGVRRPNGSGSWRSQADRRKRLAEAGVVQQDWFDAITDDDALMAIRAGHIMDLPVVREKFLAVTEQRENIHSRISAPGQIPSPVDRAAGIRALQNRRG